MNKIFLLITVAILSGCTNYQPIFPEGYTGGRATVSDTFIQVGLGEAQFFYAESVDKILVENALDITYKTSNNKGRVIYPSGYIREIPSRPLKINIIGKNVYSAPILGLLDSENEYTIQATLEFSPQNNHDYLIKGILEKNYRAIWIEDNSGEIVSSIYAHTNGKSGYISSNELKGYSQSNTKEEIYLQIRGGETDKTIVKKIGRPDNIEKLSSSLFRPFRQTIFKYNELGEIYFYEFFGTLYTRKIVPNIRDIKLELTHKLNSNDPIFLRELGISYYQTDNLSVSELDLFAKKIMKLKYSKDPYMVDALAWFCKILGASKNEKYVKFLQDLSQDDVHRKLRRYARSSFKEVNVK
ncbi:hypothetical protein [Microbulbifer sp. JMSA008]|uniref:hypothetical protein n=1 Tax=Microbulbifer sp. JMSA008 TaxID=3243373 RepID=UPI004038FB69